MNGNQELSSFQISLKPYLSSGHAVQRMCGEIITDVKDGDEAEDESEDEDEAEEESEDESEDESEEE